jgi:hypothetical protein
MVCLRWIALPRRALTGFALVLASSAMASPGQWPVRATSLDDAALRSALMELSTRVRADEARRVAACAYTTGEELRRTWHVVGLPGLQNFLVNIGARPGGLCFQWAEELLVRLDLLRLNTLEPHWAEAYRGTLREHNVIVMTAKGQPFAEGVLLDNWRYAGHLAWAPVRADTRYQWKENSAHARYVIGIKFKTRTAAAGAEKNNQATTALQSAPRLKPRP